MSLADATDNPEAAISLLEQALRDAPTQDAMADRWVKLLDRTGDVQRKASALKAHIERLEKCPDATEGQRAQAYRWLAQALALVEPREISAAIAAYEVSVDLDPESATLEALAGLYEQRNAEGDHEQAADILTSVGEALGGGEAIHRAQRALDLIPDHTEAMALLEQSMPARDHSRLLRVRLEQFIALAGTDEDANPRRVRLAVAYGEMGRLNDALDCLVPAIEHGHVEAIATRRHLLKLQEGTPFADRGESTLVGVPLPSEEDANTDTMSEMVGAHLAGSPAAEAVAVAPTAANSLAARSGPAIGGIVSASQGSSTGAELQWPPVTAISSAPAVVASSSPAPYSPESLYPSGDLIPASASRPVTRWRVAAIALAAMVTAAAVVATWPGSSGTQSDARSEGPAAASSSIQSTLASSLDTKSQQSKLGASSIPRGSARTHPTVADRPNRDKVSDAKLIWRALRRGVHLSGAPMSKRRVLSALNRQKSLVLKCYEQARELDPELEGRIVLSLILFKSGQPRATVLKGGSIRDAAMGRCVARVLHRARLPRPKQGKTRVRLPLVFTGAQ